MHHIVKCWPEFYGPLEAGEKTAELRLNDRNYRVGDLLTQREYLPEQRQYTGREITHRITHIVANTAHLMPGNVMLSLGNPEPPAQGNGYE